MPTTTIGGKRVFETGTALLHQGVTEFEFGAGAMSAKVRFAQGVGRPIGSTSGPLVIEFPEPPLGNIAFWQDEVGNGSTSYTVSIFVRAEGQPGQRLLVVHWTVTA